MKKQPNGNSSEQVAASDPVEAVTHVGDCSHDKYARQVCEALYIERTDDCLELAEALKGICTLCAGHDEQSKDIRRVALQAIAEHAVSADARCDARSELLQLQ